jgi:hypothetical protein
VYVFNQNNQIYRISPDLIELVDNGADGVLFVVDSKVEPFHLCALKTAQTSDWSGPLSDAQLRYAAILLPLADTLDAALRSAGLTRIAALEGDAMRALAWMEWTGLPVDVAHWQAQAAEDHQQAEAALAALQAIVIDEARPGEKSVDWESSPQVLRLLRAAMRSPESMARHCCRSRIVTRSLPPFWRIAKPSSAPVPMGMLGCRTMCIRLRAASTRIISPSGDEQVGSVVATPTRKTCHEGRSTGGPLRRTTTCAS